MEHHTGLAHRRRWLTEPDQCVNHFYTIIHGGYMNFSTVVISLMINFTIHCRKREKKNLETP